MTATIDEVAAYLERVGLQYMATLGLDGKPKVRPVQFMVLEDNRLWFCTNSEKAMYKELTACPAIELCGSGLARCVSDVKATFPKATIAKGFDIYGHEVRSGKTKVEKWLKSIGYKSNYWLYGKGNHVILINGSPHA